jgi:hypothetical protein
VSEGMGRWFLWRKPGEMGVKMTDFNVSSTAAVR